MFWDSSALVPCFVPESRSSETTALLSTDTVITIWWATPVECSSALEAKQRHPREVLPTPIYTSAYQRLADVVAAADHVQPVDQVRDQATEYLKQHPLRAADALQLAAALVAHQPTFVTLDERLRKAAEVEGFIVLP